MTVALRKPIQPQAGISLGDISRADASPVRLNSQGDGDGLTERRPADGTAAERRSDLLYAHRLLAWSEAIEDGERRGFEEWVLA